MYIFNGKKLTEDQAKKFAEETGRDLQTFLEANPDIQEDPDFGPQDELGKPEVAVEKVAPAVTEDTALQLENGSSGLTAYKDLTDEQKKQLNKQKKVDLGNSPEEIAKRRKASKDEQASILSTDIELDEVTLVAGNEVEETVDPIAKGFTDSIKKVTEESSKTAIATNYFNLGQGVGKMEGVLEPNIGKRPQRFKKLPSGRNSGRSEYINSLDTDTRNALGEEKYEKWIKLKNSSKGPITSDVIQDKLDLKDIPTNVIASAVQKEKYSAAESYINEKDLNEVEQDALRFYLPGDQEFKDDIATAALQRKQDQLDFEAKFGRPLLRTETIQGRTYVYGVEKSMQKAIEDQDKRLLQEFKSIESEAENLFEVDVKNYEKELLSLDASIEQRQVSITKSIPKTQEELDDLNSKIETLNLDVEKRNLYSKNTIESLNNKKLELNKRSEILTSLIPEVGLTKTANRAIQKSYALDNQFSLVMEEAFLGSGAMLAASTLKGIGDVVQFVDKSMFQREGAEDFISEDTVKQLADLKGAAVDYNQKLRKTKQEVLPETLGEDDDGYWGRMLVDNSPSILTAISTMGAGGLGVAGARAAANAATAVFFTMETGGQMANLEIQQRNAPKVISALEAELEQAKGDFEVNRIKEEIAEQKNILNKAQWQKSLNSVLYGGIAAGAERFGTLGFIKNFQKYSKAVGYNQFRKVANIGISKTLSKSLGAIGGIGVGVAIEELEETMTLIGQNLMDQAVLDIDKNTFEGLDKEFFRNVAVSSLAISGTAASQNIYSAVSQEFADRIEAKKEGKLRAQVLDIQTQLDKGGLTRKGRNLLEKSKKKVLKELALDNTKKVLKISNLTAEEFENITETNRQLRNIQKEANSIGQSGDVSSWSNDELKRLKTEYDNLLSERAKVFDNKRQEVLDLFKGQTSNIVEAANTYGLYEFAKGVAKNQKGVNQLEFNNKNDLKKYLEEGNFSDELIKKITEGYDEGANAFNQVGSNDIILFKENIVKNIALSATISGRIAAMAPLHELGHIQTRQAGIIKDGEVAGDAVKMIEGIKKKVSDLFNEKSITQEQYNAFKRRVAQYTNTDGKVDADELIQAVADFTNIGVLPKSAFNSVYEIKTYVNSVMQHINGDASMYFQLDTASDVFNFVSSWTGKAKEMIQLPAGEEDKIEEGKESRSTVLEAINELVPAEVKTKEEFQSPKVFNNVFNSLINEGGAINNYIRSRSTSKQEAEKAIESVQDRMLNFDPAATRKDGGKVGVEGFGEFIFANTNFGKMDAKKALFKEGEKASQETSLDAPEATTQLADEVSIDETKVKSTTSKLRRVLGIKQDDAIYDLAKEVSGEILKEDLPDKKLVAVINKKARESGLRQAVSDLMGTEKAIDDQFLNKNILKTLETLSDRDLAKLERANKNKIFAKQLPKLTKKAELLKAIEQRKLPKSQSLVSGAFIYDRLPVTLEQAKEFFTQKRKAGLVNVVTEMLVKDAAPEVTKDKMEPAKRAKVLSEIDRAPTLKFSLSTKQDIAFEENENEDTGHVTFEGEFEVGDTQFALKLIPLDNISDDFEAEFELKKQLEAKNIDTKELLSIEFEDFEDGLDVTGKSLEGKTSAIKTFSIVANSVLDFVKENNIKGVVFNSAEANRTRLYKAMVDRFSKELGWEYKQVKTTPVQGEVDTFVVTPKEKAKEQPTLKFSKKAREAVDNINFEVEAAQGRVKVDGLLNHYDLKSTLLIKKEEDIDAYIERLKTDVFPLMPREAFFGSSGGTAFTGSSKIFGLSSQKNKDGTTKKDKNGKSIPDELWVKIVKEFKSLNQRTVDGKVNPKYLEDSAFGKNILDANGKAIDFKIKSYSTLFKNPDTIKKNIENGEIKRFNDKIKLIHKTLWERINQSISKDKNKAVGIATYLRITANDTRHWHKQGAEFVGYSTNPIGKTNSKGNTTLYEFEHAMPATAAYLYLLDVALSKSNFKAAYKVVMENYKLIALDKSENAKLATAKLGTGMPKGWKLGENFWWQRYFNSEVAAVNGGIPSSSLMFLDGKTFQEELNINSAGNTTTPALEVDKKKASKSNNNKSAFKYSKAPTNKVTIDTAATTDKALNIARDLDAPVKKIRVFDFDDTLAQTKSDVLYTMPDGTEGKLNAEQFANDGSTLLSEGAVFDFSEFNKVTEGKKGPLFKVAQTIAAKRGTEDVFVLTARAPESQLAIYEFLKSQGLDIPLKNITGLGNSTGEAKARWIVDKAADGYNDFYFADDAPQNVKAVKDALSVIDVKSKTQQAKIKFSKSLDLDKDFNDIIENKTGIGSDKTYSRVKAQVAGASKGKFNFFIPPSAEDFVGLLYSTLGKGDVGDAQMAWYKSHLLNPFARAMENLANDRANIMQDFRGLKKSLGIVPKNLRKKIKDSNFTKEQAVRAYIWDKQGMEIPGISQKDQKDLVDFVNADAELVVFGDQLIEIGKGDAYAAPDAGWVAGNIGTDFIKALNTTKRSKYLETWQQNVDQIFSEANLNKLEAAYGANYREAMVDMLKRMKTGKNTSSGSDRLAARFTDWLTNSVGAIMFFNTRSAVLQTISAVNFINFSDNNVLKAGAAFANQPQYWSDFKKLFNSPFLLDRRSGLKLNVNEADIAAMAKGPGNSARNVIAGILKAGFLPTQLADSFAIASGGASFYRNRIKALQKEGLTEAEAEEQAFRDFREIAEESQQSSRPDKISQQQAGPLGRVVLAFANTPAQYARLIKKAASDLKNGRGDAKTNISKIIYYGVAQNLLFSALQQALFAIAFDDEEEEEKKNEKYFNIVNGMSDSVLRGIGIGGAIVSVVKNTALKLAKEADKKSPKYQDAVVKGILQISPPISSKVGKLQSAGRSYSWNQEEMRTRGWSIDNPAYLANANVISALTNVPLDRAVKKVTNIVDAGNEDIEYYKRVALALGWSAWELGIDKKGGKVAPPKTDMDKLYDLNKKQQIDSLTSLGISKKQIKLLKLEEDRVNAILNPKSIKQIKVSKRDSLFGLNKKDQVKALEKLGLTKKEIRALRLESDRVEAIINKQKQEN